MPILLSALALIFWAALAQAGVTLLPAAPRLTLPSTFVAAQDLPEITPNQAAHRAQQMNGGGKILAVDAVPGGYRVKLLKDGEVRIVFVPN